MKYNVLVRPRVIKGKNKGDKKEVAEVKYSDCCYLTLTTCPYVFQQAS